MNIRSLVAATAIGSMTALGCASSPSVKPEIAVAPVAPKHAIRIVAKTPSSRDYTYLGKVVGESMAEEFVEAARSAQAQVLERARALGADLITIDRVSPGTKRHGVLLAGRAYRIR